MFLAITAFVFLVGGVPAGAVSGTETGGGLFVTGDGEVMLKADVAYVQLAVETFAKTTVEAQRENARLTTAVIVRLGGLKLSEDAIKSAGYSVRPVMVYDNTKGKQELTGYQVNNQLSVTVADLEKVGAVVDTAVAAGANAVYDVTFTASDVSGVQAEALRLACAEARAKATVIADSLGVKLGRVLSVADEAPASTQPYLRYAKAGVAAEAAPPTPFLPGEVKVRARVTVQFDIDG
jgi:uncharacterized protein YggE